MTARDSAARAGVLAVPAAALLTGCGGPARTPAPAPAATSPASIPAAPGSPTTTLLVTDFGADTRVVPVGRRPFDVRTVDTATWATRRIEVAPYGTRGGLGSWLKPHYTAVRPSDGALLLPFEGERLAVVDPATGRVTVEP